MTFLPLFNVAKLKNNKDLPKIAEVINNEDPKKLGRIKVKLEGFFDPVDKKGSNLPWIRKMSSEMGIGVEERNVPAEGDKVELIWPYDEKHAFYRGIPFGASNKIGYRIMGIQKGEIFKNRYYTRNLRKNFFKKKYLNFFKKRKE